MRSAPLRTGDIALAGVVANNHTRMNRLVMPGLISSSHGSALIAGRVWVGGTSWGCNMSSIDCAKSAYVAIKGKSYSCRVPGLGPGEEAIKGGFGGGPRLPLFGPERSFNCFVVVLRGGVRLRPCLLSPPLSGIPNLLAPVDRLRCTIERHHSSPTGVSHPRKNIPRSRGSKMRPRHRSPRRELPASYTEGQQTASGEKFDTNDLTAAHPTLPFGTRWAGDKRRERAVRDSSGQ